MTPTHGELVTWPVRRPTGSTGKNLAVHFYASRNSTEVFAQAMVSPRNPVVVQPRRLGRLLLAVAMLAGQLVSIIPNPVNAASAPPGKPFTAFGPEDYTYSGGPPAMSTASFAVRNPAPAYVLHVLNGGAQNQYQRVTAGSIALNGTIVVAPSEFNPQASVLDKPIQPAASNHLTVVVVGPPTSGLTLQIIGYDNDPPTITASASPAANSAGWNSRVATRPAAFEA